MRLGVFDANLPPILTVDSATGSAFRTRGRILSTSCSRAFRSARSPNCAWAIPAAGLIRLSAPLPSGRRTRRCVRDPISAHAPCAWGAVFNNPAAFGTGLLSQDFPQGQIKYVDLDLRAMQGKFVPDINVPLKPFQGTLGVAPPDDFFPPLSPGVTSSVPPGPHGGNLDLRELSEGSTLYVPVWQPGALIYTGDCHAVQGDGEITLTALETRMQEVRVQVVLHKQKNFPWPVAETDSHWIIVGLDKDLNTAMALAARNAIEFLSTRAKMTPLDAYALCSIAVSFRVTQVVDIVRGVHAMIPKSIFASELRREMTMV